MSSTIKTAYCIFCEGKDEERLADKLRGGYGYELLVPKRKSLWLRQGVYRQEDTLLTPGYIFLYANAPIEADKLAFLQAHYHFLSYTDGASALTGGDHAYAMWVYAHGGMLGLTEAVRNPETRRVEFLSGPLAEPICREILRVKPKHRCAQVALTFMGEPRPLWLSFALAG